MISGLLFFSPPAFSQENGVLKPGTRNVTGAVAGERGQPFDFVLYGKTYKLTPIMFSHSTMDWEGAKRYLPEGLDKAPEVPLSDQEVLERIEDLARVARLRYGEQVRYHAAEMIGENPSMPASYAEREIAGDLHSGSYAETNPNLQFIHDQNLALGYLEEMLREAMGYGPPRW